MKILFITRKYPPAVGGMELFAAELSQALAGQTEIELVAWGGRGRLKAVLVALPSLAWRAFRALRHTDIDVIHVQDGVLAPLGLLLGKLFHKPYVVVVHGLDVTYSNPLFRAVALPALRRADAVIAISGAAADAARQAGVLSDRLEVITLAVSDNLYKTSNRSELLKSLNVPADSRLLLTVGRLVKRKGVSWFIGNVLPGLVARHPDIIYLVVGEGNERPAIAAAIAETGMTAHVRLLGRANQALRAAAYNGADIFVMPNIRVPDDMEGFGLVLLEASLCTLPIVAADLEGISDAVANGKNAILVAPEDEAAFAWQIEAFLANPPAARSFGRQSRRYTLSHYSWPVLAERYLDVYRRVGRH